MDKETLSHYGWIVIVVLVLAIMLTLATPFGTYIGDAIVETARGFVGTAENNLNEDSIKEKQNKWEDMLGKFPDAPAKGDIYEEGDYKYTYNRGGYYGTEWSVEVKDKTKTEYGEILSEIAGKPVTNMWCTFVGCTSLTTAPTIPSSVKNMYGTFVGCTSLTTAPAIPNSVTDMSSTFSDCTSLTTAPTIPNSVTSMRSTFSDCTSLTTAPAIPSSVRNMMYTFEGCTSLTTAPTIPSSVKNMYGTFSDCTSLTTAPAIPNSVTDMGYTFEGCTSLTTAPTIPSSVTDMSSTFHNCKSLTGTITINANPTDYADCFIYTVKSITLTGSSTKLSALAATAKNGNVTVQ